MYVQANGGFPAFRNVTEAHADAWIAGLAAAGQKLRSAVGPNVPVIHNPGALAPANVTGANGVMFEMFYPDATAIKALQTAGSLGLLAEVHSAVNGPTPRDEWAFLVTLGAFLIGASDYFYFGGGTSWENCTQWMLPAHTEYDQPLGAPHGPAEALLTATGTWSTDWLPGNATVFRRTFGDNTTVWLNSSGNGLQALCVRWSNGVVTDSGVVAPPPGPASKRGAPACQPGQWLLKSDDSTSAFDRDPCNPAYGFASMPHCNASDTPNNRARALAATLSVKQLAAFVQTAFQKGDRTLGLPQIQATTCLMGAVANGYGANANSYNTTALPCPITMAATWDRALIHRAADMVSTEVRSLTNGLGSGNGLICWDPVLNTCRDPRWGRCQEVRCVLNWHRHRSIWDTDQ